MNRQNQIGFALFNVKNYYINNRKFPDHLEKQASRQK